MQLGDIVAGRFELVEMVGSGGTGVVYRAHDRLDGPDVALKFLSSDDQADTQRGVREASVLADLTHPGIVRYVAHGIHPSGSLYLAMEWLEGLTLEKRLRTGRLEIDESLRLARRVAEALASAHARGVVHRDIKPSNLLLAGQEIDRVKVLDFGLARQTMSPRPLTRTGTLVGTPGYMAPEQARGARDVGPPADVFSLGCVLYECLTGRPPFVGQHLIAVLAKVLLEEVSPVRELREEVSPALENLVQRMLSKEAARRPADAAGVVAELNALERARGVRDLPVGPPRQAGLTGREQRVLCLVLAGRGARLERHPTEVAPTLDSREVDLRDTVSQALEPLGGKLEPLAGGALMVAVSGDGAATDQAARAARCALALRNLLSEGPIVVVTGRGMIAERLPVGAVIDRGVQLLRAVAATGAVQAVRLDEVTAGLLDARFDVAGDENGLRLLGEMEEDSGRTLMGRVTPLVGRDRELATLDAIFDECVGEPVARAVIVTAPPGAGKSRLRREFIARVRERVGPVEVLVGQAGWLTAGAPFELLSSAMRRLVGIREADPPETRLQKLRARLSRHLAGKQLNWVASELQQLVTATSGGREGRRDAGHDSRLIGDVLRSAWEAWLAAECAAQPVIFALEEVELGDQTSLQFIDHALRHLHESPLMVMALARPELHAKFPGLWAEREVQEIRLGALTRKASERLARLVLGGAVSSADISRIVERAEGNAYYLEELIRAVASGGGETLPDSVLGMVQTRMDKLPPEARRVLRAASVFGLNFCTSGVRFLLGDDWDAVVVDDWLHDLFQRELIYRTNTGSASDLEYAFRDELVRESAYAMLTDNDRALGHRLAGEWLAANVEEPDPLLLAEHFVRGGVASRAVEGYRRSAELAMEANDWTAAIERANRGIECGAQGEPLGALHLVLAEAYRWTGQPAEAARHSALAAREHLPGSARWFAAVGEALVCAARLGGTDRAVAWLEQARAAPVVPGAEDAQIVCLCRGASQLLQAGRREVASATIEQAVELAGDPSRLDPIAAARLHRVRAKRALYMGDLAEFWTEQGAAVAAFERAGDKRNACSERAELGFAYARLGDYVRAREALIETLADAEEMELHQVAAWARNNLGNVLAQLGVLERARQVEEQAINAGRAQRDRRLEGGSRVYMALICLSMGNIGRAEEEAKRAVDLLDVAPPRQAAALAALGRILLAQDRTPEAFEPAHRAMRILEELKGIEEGEALVRLTYAEVLAGIGEANAAVEAIRRAAARLEERAALLPNPELRDQFLTRVPDHARTLSLLRAWEQTPPSIEE